MKKAQLEALRALLKESTSNDLYDIFGVIRGPDIVDQLHYKSITKAIRTYIGMTMINCSGSLGLYLAKGELEGELRRLAKDNETSANSHYIQHLKFAVRAIGKKNLIAYNKRF